MDNKQIVIEYEPVTGRLQYYKLTTQYVNLYDNIEFIYTSSTTL